MATTPTTMAAASTMVMATNKKEKEKKKKFISAPRLRRGRSMTSRNCTNACNIYKERDLKKKKKHHHHYDDEKDHYVVDGGDGKSFVATERFFADRFALFGDSTIALFCSFLLLAIAVSINLFLEDDNNIEEITRMLMSSSFLSPSSMFPRKYSRIDNNNNNNNNNRCANTPDTNPVLSKSGDINQLFERIVAVGADYTHRNETIYTNDYSITVHSRPDGARIGSQNRRRGVVQPWMVTLENFMTEDECDAMIRDGHKEGFYPSIDAKERSHRRTPTPNTTSTTMRTVGRRNSETAWCTSKNNCTYREVPDRLHRRLSEILGIPSENSEGFQILKYDVGQFYSVHHDYIPHQRAGPRVLTVLLYLSDADAGGTNFPMLNRTIQPRKGRALIFPNVLDSDPMESDVRMRHEAIRLESGTKYAANIWYHMHDYDLAVGANGYN